MKEVKLSDGNKYHIYGEGKKAFIASIYEAYSKEVVVMADSKEIAVETLSDAEIIMEPDDYISDTFRIDIIEKCRWEVVEEPIEELNKFTHLTITGEDANEKFKAETGLLPDNAEGFGASRYFDYHDIDLCNCPGKVFRALGMLGVTEYQFTTEE